jgi:GLPGLI family protein
VNLILSMITPVFNRKMIILFLIMNHRISYACLAALLTVFSFSTKAQISVDATPRDPRQKAVIDEVHYKFTYRTMFSEDTLGRAKYYDNQVLEIGSKYVRYYSLFAEMMDSTWYKYSVTGEKKSSGDSYKRTEDLQSSEIGQYEDIFFNYPEQGLITVINAIRKKTYSYSETTPSFDWKITGNTAQVLGYECNEAVTDFRGRRWHAWFTYDIPLRYGPWKLGGLPGLILKAEDADGLYTYELIGIQKPQSVSMCMYDTPQVIKCKREDILRINDMRWKDPYGHATSNGVNIMRFYMKDPKTGKMRAMTPQEYAAFIGYIPQRELE